MPFLATKTIDGVAVEPSDVGEKFRRREELVCPHCENELKYKKAGTDDEGNRVNRAHFFHSENVGGDGNVGGCSIAGESPEHEKWKLLIADTLKQKYRASDYYVEKQIGTRVADIVIHTSKNDKIGVEYQHKNRDKDYLAVTQEYIKNGYGVHWVFNTSKSYKMLFTAKEEIKRYAGREPYLGEKNQTKVKGLVRLGELITLENIEPTPTQLKNSWRDVFNKLNIKYKFQQKSTNGRYGKYVPDFYLPNIGLRSTKKSGIWVEVVRTDLEDLSWDEGIFRLLRKVADESDTPVALVNGRVPNQNNSQHQYQIDTNGWVDWPMEWVKCLKCGKMKYEFMESNYRVCESCDKRCSPNHEDIANAAKEAYRDWVIAELWS